MIRILFCLLLMSSSASIAEEVPADLRRIIEGAHEQIGVTLNYDPSYRAHEILNVANAFVRR